MTESYFDTWHFF